jgi:ribonucleoside-diphosphate reductase alpha chain
MEFNQNQLEVLNRRFLLTRNGIKETFDDMCQRVSENIASATLQYNDRDIQKEKQEYFEIINQLLFVPATPFLMNCGTDKQQLFSCFVSEIQDNLESIYDELKTSAKIFAGSGGVGYTFGNLRPEGSKVGMRGESSGVLAFMNLFNVSCETIKAGSGGRRGAMLAALPVDNPEIINFINIRYSD